ncbi:N-acetylglucosamine kinase [Clostridium cadaveris]|uniref:N-acetylglucosamine kinase n=1 Tax=Clostridium cadaveris TaxID=1529 RepID=UPI0015B71AB1|nr:BadF/BadG/BcrA/BcrD ATPase family protein [Clostridium cadaveris]NWK11886.1 ATPase [Clostridium cadaveris]
MYYLGVDGGGTKTRYILIDENFNTKVDIERGTIHIHQIGIEGLKREITTAVHDICDRAKISLSEIENIFLAIPGYGESENDKKIIDDALKEILKGVNYRADNDCVAGWAAGTGCKEGINIVAGTGSIAFGKNRFGKTARCGGWGYSIGDDGGAYWIAIKLLNEYTKEKDGRKPRTKLVDIVDNEYGIDKYFGIVDMVYNKYNLSRTDIASVAKTTYLGALEGVEECIKIYEEAAGELFRHIKSLSQELDFKDDFIVSYTGSVFKAGDFILEPMRKLIEKENINCILSPPKLEPWNGAALMAYVESGKEIPKQVTFNKLI